MDDKQQVSVHRLSKQRVSRLILYAGIDDPFDRLIVAQAITESLPILTHDAKLSLYPVELIW